MCVANVQVIVGAYISMDLFDVWDLVNAKWHDSADMSKAQFLSAVTVCVTVRRIRALFAWDRRKVRSHWTKLLPPPP